MKWLKNVISSIFLRHFCHRVVDDCLTNGTDVTAGGAKYNLSGIQAIQVANMADSLAVLKKLVFDDRVR